jgi:hypothetical protein
MDDKSHIAYLAFSMDYSSLLTRIAKQNHKKAIPSHYLLKMQNKFVLHL